MIHTYKVNTSVTAQALQRYWKNKYGVDISYRPVSAGVEILANEISEIPMWEQVNDAFIAGRISTVD